MLFRMQRISNFPFGPISLSDVEQVNILKAFLTDLSLSLQTSKSGKLLPGRWASNRPLAMALKFE